ncbi:cysteinyl-tRNA synthetase [Dethiosulfatibacter aminovorans DSM 17477]|uniref:Cysteine--tRNA ligase n=1 Tax=Dethiosulfatibacter aminovorans DSM 17477 TaxID=1121476 RepID=A0A1M6KGH4_9FIRM|nr:cysteine--tRNA ligase [Dethiosulfatibacter aminovorans]SHJ58049.1 cysteinyl-tRNA synthetase [Dethiosulfatibacter aminovorans DSM 17477]
MRLYNTLTRKKEEFIPIEEDKVKMYACGPTVYNFIHVGNARPAVIFDTLRRYFKYKGYEVKYVVNFTDIDDKLINRAIEEDTTVKELAERYIKEYLIDTTGLNILEEETLHPKATEYIGGIIKFIKGLEEKDYAYNIDGNVYFDTTKLKDYGKLSKKNLEDLISGARVQVNDEKRTTSDFALWKKEKPGEPSWGSPWGKGRPGWHIECSVMAKELLGDTIDIHAGGEDLQFPHHENEIAQSESLTGKPFARYWLHNGMINIDNQKMSKSLNNFFTVRDVSKEYDLEILRFFIVSGHYRKPINYSRETIHQADASLQRLYNCKRNLKFYMENNPPGEVDEAVKLKMIEFRNQFENAMDDDINTADAVTALFEIAKFVNSTFDEFTSRESAGFVNEEYLELAEVLGILYKEVQDEISEEAMALINKRIEARKNKDFKLADELRDALLEIGVEVEDTRDGVKWKKI